MIKIEKTEVLGWEHAIRGMRNPMNSWDKSDSLVIESGDSSLDRTEIGPNDHKLMMQLAKGGPVHGKFRRMITVYMDITAPLYWWSEYDTYKVGTVANSCSKMHRLLHKPFEMNDFSFDKLPGFKREVKYFVPEIEEGDEKWKPSTENECYMVSNEGRISRNGRILSGSIHSDGYIFVNMQGKSYAKHRIVAKAFIPNPENKPFVNHIDGNKQNNKVENLEWCTQSENIKHAVKQSLQPKGLSAYKGKFTPEQRQEIKNLWDSGKYSRRELALKHDVSHTCINDIINDKYKYATKTNIFEEVARPIIDILNELRDSYFLCEDEKEKKQIWYSILQMLPMSYNQKRTVMLNYEVLHNIYESRKNHKLDEWHTFCDWIEGLPYPELITGGDVNDCRNESEQKDNAMAMEFTEQIEKLKSEVEKYRKAFEDAKKERDCQIAEYQNRTEKDKTELEKARNTVNQIDDILEKLFGVRHDAVDDPEEFEKILDDREKGDIADFLLTEPIKIADMLINAEGEYERDPFTKAFCGEDKGTYRIFDASELRQIAGHLLVYCNHNGEVEG